MTKQQTKKFSNMLLKGAMCAMPLAFMCACSNEMLDPASEKLTANGNVDYVPVKVVTDQSVLGRYVVNHKRAATKAGAITSADEKEMPISMPSKPEKYILTSDVANYYWFASTEEEESWGVPTHDSAKTQVVEADTEYSASMAPIGQSIYVYGHLTISGWGTSPDYAGDCVIYVMPGGELTFDCGGGLTNNTDTELTIYNWGTLSSSTGNSEDTPCQLEGITIHSETAIEDIDYLTFHGCQIYAYGGITASWANVTGFSYVYCGCNMIVDVLTVQNGSEISTQYLKADRVELKGNDEYMVVCLRNGGLWEVGYLYFEDCDHIQVGAPVGEDSLIIADFCEVNDLDLTNTFVNTYLNCTSWGGDNNAARYFNSMTSYDANFTEYFASSCHLNVAASADVYENNGTCANKVFTVDEGIFEEVADIDATHTHPISATCIAVDGNSAYVSWHLRGGNVWGCLEKISLAGDQVTLDSWLETPAYLAYSDEVDNATSTPKGVSGKEIEDIQGASMGTDVHGAHDFNHIIIGQRGYLIAVGDHHKKGGFIGALPLSAFSMEGQLDEVFVSQQLGREKYDGDEYVGLVAGRSGNAVVCRNDIYHVASRGGYQSYYFVGENFENWKAMDTDGSVKHIALDSAAEYAYAIEYTEDSSNENWWNDNTSTLSATIKRWDVRYGNMIAAKTIATTEAFGPVFGKDVIEYADGMIYSCQGWNGVHLYSDSGAELAAFKVAEWVAANADKVPDCVKGLTQKQLAASAANGLCVDGDYCYVAYGGAGVWMLDKETLEPVAAYYRTGDTTDEDYYGTGSSASANYIKVMEADGSKYLVIAYGRAGVRVIKVNA